MIDVRLSRDIENGATARPRYATDVVTTEGGWEFRNERWEYPLFEFDFSLAPGDQFTPDNDIDPNQALGEFVDLWHAAGGRANTFLFRHWADYRAREQEIGIGDGTTTQFQLYRNYVAGAVTRQRKITRPVLGSVVLYSEGVAVAGSVDVSTGIVTYTSAPIDSALLTADFDFDLPVRFANDELEIVALMTDLDQPIDIELVEVRERTAD